MKALSELPEIIGLEAPYNFVHVNTSGKKSVSRIIELNNMDLPN